MQENEIKMRDAVIAMITRMAEHRSVDVAYAAAPALKALADWDAVHCPPADSQIRFEKRDDGWISLYQGSTEVAVFDYTCFPPEANRWLTAASDSNDAATTAEPAVI